MKRSISMSSTALGGALVIAALGSACSAADGGIETTSSDGASATSTAELRHRSHSPTAATTTTTTTPGTTSSSTTSSDATTATSSSTTSSTDAQSIIAAAQTADGAAIPQAAGPGGVCPDVVVLLGFWSCPELDQTCSFAKDGAAHACVCTRTDGEGQFPTWVCQ